MVNVSYTISSGVPNFTVTLSGDTGFVSGQTQTALGTYVISNVPNGSYTLRVIDSNGCLSVTNLLIYATTTTASPTTTTTSTTASPTTTTTTTITAPIFNEISFPGTTVSTITVTSVLVSDGGSAITDRGICYNTTGSPTTSDPKVSLNNVTGSLTTIITGLTYNTGYYFCAYATNIVGTTYYCYGINHCCGTMAIYTLDYHLCHNYSLGNLSNPVSASYNVSPSATVIILTIEITQGSLRTGGAPTYNGVSLIEAGSHYGTFYSEIWYLNSPSSGTNTLSIPNTALSDIYYTFDCFQTDCALTVYNTTEFTSSTSLVGGMVSIPSNSNVFIISAASILYNGNWGTLTFSNLTDTGLFYGLTGAIGGSIVQYKLYNSGAASNYTMTANINSISKLWYDLIAVFSICAPSSIPQVIILLYSGATSSLACSNTTVRSPDAYINAPLGTNPYGINMHWYTSSAFSFNYPDGTYALHDSYNSYNGYWSTISSGIVTASGICLATTTTTLSPTTTTTTTFLGTTTTTTSAPTTTTTLSPTTTTTTISLVSSCSYGLLYNGYVISDTRGIAPSGWHVPTDDDWTILQNTLGTDYTVTNNNALKYTGTGYWNSPNSGATNTTGFYALGGGYRTGGVLSFPIFSDMKDNGYWATSTITIPGPSYPSYIFRRIMYAANYTIYRDTIDLNAGMSIRLIKNDSINPGTVSDRDGNVYNTVLIGTQVWTVQNLKVQTYLNGNVIPNITDSTQWATLATGGLCSYNNDWSNACVTPIVVTVPPTTTTTTTVIIYSCDALASYGGGQAYPSIQTITLGANTGTVILNYDTRWQPDLILVYFDGALVINTGYRGGASFDFGGSNRIVNTSESDSFINSLNGKFDPVAAPFIFTDPMLGPVSLPRFYPNHSLYPDDGYPRIAGPGVGSASFYKNSVTTTATVKVYSPIPGTIWSYTLSCPTLKVGDSYGGGYVAYILPSGTITTGSGTYTPTLGALGGYDSNYIKGLIVAPADQPFAGFSSQEPWWNGAYTNVSSGFNISAANPSWHLGSGSGNTSAIIASQGNTGTYAAKLCRDYAGGGYTDWFLPSLDELDFVWKNSTIFGGVIPSLNCGVSYWTSNEWDGDPTHQVWAQYFGWEGNIGGLISSQIPGVRYKLPKNVTTVGTNTPYSFFGCGAYALSHINPWCNVRACRYFSVLKSSL